MNQPERTEPLPEAIGGTLHLFTDGGSRGNPGEAAIACILEDPARGITLREHAERIGVETNNVAEYRALIEGLKLAEDCHPNRLVCHLDSELIVKQLNGEYRVKMATLEPLHRDVQELSMFFPDVVFRHIPREDNYRADALVNKALDANPSRPHVPRASDGGQMRFGI
ncbi:ribonuclease HI family protein [Candidatus Peregrinibacteria bacterium]|nr:ribonuclease HI family protein [Candidatus Peregrinibacteria bacterium]